MFRGPFTGGCVGLRSLAFMLLSRVNALLSLISQSLRFIRAKCQNQTFLILHLPPLMLFEQSMAKVMAFAKLLPQKAIFS